MEKGLPESLNKEDGPSDHYPHNTKPLENQVAGHSFSVGNFTIGNNY